MTDIHESVSAFDEAVAKDTSRLAPAPCLRATEDAPLERVRECGDADRVKLAQLDQTFKTHDPFELSKKIDQKLEAIFQFANARMSPRLEHSGRE